MVKSLQSGQNLLASARKRRGWTQAYVAQQVNVSTDTVRQWERGRHLPYQATIQQLCDLFQMAPEALGLFDKQILLPHANGTGIRASDDALSERQNQQYSVYTCTNEQKAAWEIYIELVTRIATAPLEDDTGLLREALSSFYSLFHQMRGILRSYDPTIASSDQDTRQSLCSIVVHMLNTTLRPLLSKWHPLLKDYEDQRPVSVGALAYEQQWEKCAELRQEIASTQKELLTYVNILAQIAGIPSLSECTPDSIL